MIHTTGLFSLLAYSLPVLCCFCYGLMLIFRRESKVKRVMGFVMLMSSICFAISLAYDAMVQQDGKVPILNIWHMGAILMICPLIGWYFNVLIRPSVKFFPYHFVLLIPFFLSIIGTFLFIMYAPPTPDVYTVKDYFSLLKSHPEAVYRLVLAAVFLTEAIYWFVHMELQLKIRRKQIKNDFSYAEKDHLNWVQTSVCLTLFCFLLFLIYAFTSSVGLRTIYSILFFVVIVALCIYGENHSNVYDAPTFKRFKKLRYAQPRSVMFFAVPEQNKLKINNLIYEKIRRGLIDLLEQQEVYCKPDLRLEDLADMLNTNKTYVSLVINEAFHTNFYSLVNQYRVKKSIALLRSARLQIKDVWMQSGFNSQSTFNIMFKKEMRLTPSEWSKKMEYHEYIKGHLDGKSKPVLNRSSSLLPG